MRDVEQKKQEIILGLENVRLLGSFLLPILAAMVAVMFSDNPVFNNRLARMGYVTALFLLEGYFFLMRLQAVKDIKEMIKKI